MFSFLQMNTETRKRDAINETSDTRENSAESVANSRFVLFIEDLTRVVISYEMYETSLRRV